MIYHRDLSYTPCSSGSRLPTTIRPSHQHQTFNPQHQALVEHQDLPQHQTLVQHQTFPERQTLLQPQTLPQYQAPHLQYEVWQPYLSDGPEHTQAAPEQQDNSSCRRCIFRNHLWSSSSWGLSRPRRGKERHLCRTQWRLRARSPALLPPRVGFALLLPRCCPSRFKVSLTSQA